MQMKYTSNSKTNALNGFVVLIIGSVQMLLYTHW